MLFGQSIFQSVLTRLKEERGEDGEEEAGESFRQPGLGVGFVAPTSYGPDTAAADGPASRTEAYFDFLPEEAERPEPPRPEPEPEPIKPPPIPAHLTRLTQEEVATELAIGPHDTEATLADKRRLFAKTNHPDAVSPEFRENANTRMTIANLLIDKAIRNLARR